MSERQHSWDELYLGDFTEIMIGGTPSRANASYWDPSKETKNIWVSIRDLKQGWITDSTEYLSDEGVRNSNVKLVPKGTVLMSFKLTVGRVARAGRDLYTNEAIAAFLPKNSITVSPDFLYYGLQEWDLLTEVDQAIKGATLNKDKLSRISCDLPPLAEQKKIAEILSAVDEVIENTESEISKLEDLKKATLNELLTKGIGHTEFKETEIGRIPKSWKVVPLGDIVKFGGGSAFSESLQGEKQGDFPFIKVSDMNHIENTVWIVHSENWIAKSVKAENKIKLFPVNAVVFAKVGAALMLNRRRILSRPTAIDNNMMAAIPHGCDSKFLYWLMCRMDFRRLVQDGAVPSVNQSQLDEIVVALPNASEQRDIAVRLDCLASVIEEKNTGRDAMVRVRAGLMQDLLTGKVRVKVN